MADVVIVAEEQVDEGLSQTDFEKYLWEIRQQPAFRRTADRDCEYYDGNQFDAETIARYKELGLGAVFENLVRPTVDVVLGMEAKTRTDWRVNADDDNFADVAEALSAKLAEAERESRADRACSDGYTQQIKAGFGVVEVARETDPFRYPYRVRSLHRNEVFWDWTSKLYDWSDCRYVIRRNWLDMETVISVFPDQEPIIRASGSGAWLSDLHSQTNTVLLERAFDAERRTTIEEYEWRDSDTGRVAVYECWYRVPARGVVMKLPDGRVMEADMKNTRHVEAIMRGFVQAYEATFTRMRVSFWLGCHRLSDTPTPYKHNKFPYVPFFGFREDLTGIPYGLIRNMVPLQDEVNARRAKMMWLLSAKRVIRTEGAAKDPDFVREDVARPDADIVLDGEHMRNGGIFKVEQDFQLSTQQYQIMQDSRDSLQRAAGVYQAMMGDARGSGVNSGLAINSLVEQGSTTLGEINDNYRFARRLVGELLLELIREDIGTSPTVVSAGEDGNKQIKLNHVQPDENGVPALVNDVRTAMVKVALEDIPSTPAYRSQQLMFFTEMLKSAPPQVQAILMPYYIESTELPKRKEIAKQVRAVQGMSDDQDPVAARYQQIIQQLQQQINELTQQVHEKQSALDTSVKVAEIRAQAPVQVQELKTSQELAMANQKIDKLQETLAQMETIVKDLAERGA